MGFDYDYYNIAGIAQTLVINCDAGESTFKELDTASTVYKYAYADDGKAYVRYLNADWINIEITNRTDNLMELTVEVSKTSLNRSAQIYFQTADGTGYFTGVWQYAEYYPLYMNRTFNVGDSFCVENPNHENVFEGQAYSRRLDVSKIVQNIMPRPEYSSGYGHLTSGNCTGIYEVLDADDGQPLRALPYIYCWDYEMGIMRNPTILNESINGTLTPGMTPTCTAFMTEPSTMELWRCGVKTDSETFGWDGDPDITCTNSNDFSNNDIEPGDEIVFRTPENLSLKYKVVCADYGVYYLNRKGTYDTFAFEGNCVITDSYTRTSFIDEDTSRDITNNLTRTYRISTGWLTDEESERLAFNLMPSVNVILDERGRNIPVIITDTETEVKKFRNGHNLNRYTITFERSKDHINR